MIGVGQANRILEFVSKLQEAGSRELKDRATLNSRCFVNPFDKDGTNAPYIFITKKGQIKFGHTLVGASLMAESTINKVMSGALRPATPSCPVEVSPAAPPSDPL